jgi:hypothetical protein
MLPSIYNIAYRYLCERKCKNITKYLFMAMAIPCRPVKKESSCYKQKREETKL